MNTPHEIARETELRDKIEAILFVFVGTERGCSTDEAVTAILAALTAANAEQAPDPKGWRESYRLALKEHNKRTGEMCNEIAGLKLKLEMANRANAEQAKDTERLDWLEADGNLSKIWHTSVGLADRSTNDAWFWEYRQAIDAACEQEGKA